MAFIELFNTNYEKLTSKSVVNILWKEMLQEDRSEDHLDALIEYSFHYPVDSEAYLQELHEKFDMSDKSELRTIDGHLKAYIITFLYYCTNRYGSRASTETTLLASTLYIKLVSMPNIGKIFFEPNMFKVQLAVCVNMAKDKSVTEDRKKYFTKLLKKFVHQDKPDINILQGIANSMVMAGLAASAEVVNSYEQVNNFTSYCLNSVWKLIQEEQDDEKHKFLWESFFRCLRKNVMEGIPNKPAAVSVIVAYVRDVLQNEMDMEHFQNVLDAFCLVWGRQDFDSFEEAVVMMNFLKIQYYKELLRRMVLFSQSKHHKKYHMNVFNLFYGMMKNIPNYSLDKLDVFATCIFRNIIFHFVNSDKNVANRAIGIVCSICLLKDNPLVNSLFDPEKGIERFISMEALLSSFHEIADQKWGASPRNQNLLSIMATFLPLSNIHGELVVQTLQILCKDCTPYSLKHSLPVLHEMFCQMASKEQNKVAEGVLKIIFKMAMHQDAGSAEYCDHIFTSLLNPSVIDGISYGPKYYYNIFLTSEFDYEALFIKCQKKIRPQHVKNVINNLDNNEAAGAVLLCCLLNHCRYEEIGPLMEYLIVNFGQISVRPIAGPLCVAFQMILENRTISEEDIPHLDILQSLILEALLEHNFPVHCLKPAYLLFRKIRDLLRIDTQEQTLNQLMHSTSERAFNRLHARDLGDTMGDTSSIMYLNELCLLLKKLPSVNVLTFMESYMDNPIRVEVAAAETPDIYLQLITLFTTIAMMKKVKVPQAVQYLKRSIKDRNQITKILAFKLYYTLCQEMTHEYEDVLRFAFKEVVYGDPCLVRICITTLEELIHHDFTKLDAYNFFRFIYVLGCDDLCIFMKEILKKRFVFSNVNDISKFYVQSIVHVHMFTKLSSYPITGEFEEDLVRIKFKMDTPKELVMFLFNVLPLKKKVNVLSEISLIFKDVMQGNAIIEDSFFEVMKDLILPFKLALNGNDATPDKHYYNNICKAIEKQIINHDASYKPDNTKVEHETSIRQCTISLLDLLFFENAQLAEKIQIPLFDAVMHWVDFVKAEIVHYIYEERGKGYGTYFNKLVKFYRSNKTKFVTPDR